ncbi:hypothetical protein ADL30_20055 [Streptomyces sp. NRRL S-1521]|nr:hypothetical protein ADL30_20055 [Streptomyces sp. NRRL S-1521]
MPFTDEGPGPCFGSLEPCVVDHWRSLDIVESHGAVSAELCEIGNRRPGCRSLLHDHPQQSF